MALKYIFILLFLGIAVLGGTAVWRHGAQLLDDGPRVSVKGASGTARVGGPFQLIDHHGRPMSDADLRGRPALIFFGYTQCPDVCPTTLLKLAEALDLLGADGAAILPVFITVDPLRDTPEVIADYIANFHPRLIGLTGTRQQIAIVERAYAVYARTGEDAEKYDTYLVDHTALAYLMGADGTFRTFLAPNESPEDMAAKIREFL